jgi:putative ABC transport system substrate-binding protein
MGFIQLKRRDFITCLAAAWPLASRAQQPAMPVIGWLSPRRPDTDAPLLALFRQSLSEAGFVDGRNVALESRWAEGRYDRVPALAAELVNRQVTVIVTVGGEFVAHAAKAATTSIPIVFVAGADPVKTGLVSSFHRPGGNVTGITTFLSALGTKRLGLLREFVPNAAKIAVFGNPNDPLASGSEVAAVQTAALAIGQQLNVLNASTEQEIDLAFADSVKLPAHALLVATDPFFLSRADQFVALAARYAIPTLYFRREFARAGGLVSYGSSVDDNYRSLGAYVSRILAGAKPADLPIMQPTKFEMVVNLQTAKALGLAVPPMLLARADEVIE